MKANEVDILIVPGHIHADKEHWQSRWEAKLSTAQYVRRPGGAGSTAGDWAAELAAAVKARRKPVMLVAHAFGVPLVLQALPQLGGKICGGFFVSPPDITKAAMHAEKPAGLAPYPLRPLPFPSIVIAARDDPFCDFAAAEKLAQTWHSLFFDAGLSGHIDAQSGHGPWPEGLMVFSRFLAHLPEPDRAKAAAQKEEKA